MSEEWRPVIGYEGYYEVSSYGKIRSLGASTRSSRELVQQPSHGGYFRVSLFRHGERRTWHVHRVVATAFLRTPTDGEVCRHLNHDPTDNRASNLAWGSPVDNMADMIEAGRHGQQLKDRCGNGHPFDEANTKVYLRRGRRNRICRACVRENTRRWRSRQIKGEAA